ncbi:hypothetical protein A3A71_04070 [Candidatus Berkelbacteria bacterium RIFCSPLOWO2_01_FULL_50_28]|uniref:Cohesin domain-containing protein n=1 Tax=Candidatus Berkelbacteria bacterium RIFCSPLOWO2_01_FULL_50_28 TaxID=1797471 RepID=A0A1F5EAN8_9BACT|nr:MAG: hypothetical protein A2807_03540 [Candidatus Berkelbacteria bacterium RIFCSPHIGHO2_01_FULL_50_36]OGD64314.1 MAG: hypothetical protein A3A71_04070 [Candidatus Berkelbacteria bacterium RIFCSPLOWO2_01_FULL_50_28]
MKARTPLRSERLVFTIVVIITVILLVGSAILQRIVFKAESVNGALHFTPTTLVAPLGKPLSLVLQSDFDASSLGAGIQVSIDYDPTALSLDSVKPSSGWTTAKIDKSPGTVFWVAVPSGAAVSSLSTRSVFATFVFRPLKNGPAEIKIDPTRSAIALMTSDATAVYNALNSVQNSVLTIAPSGASPIVASESTEPTPTNSGFGLQRLVSTDEIALPQAAIVLVKLQFSGRVVVNFGLTSSLSGSVESSSSSMYHALKLSGLESAKTYYYQVATTDSQGSSKLLGAVKSFQTVAISRNLNVDQYSFQVFPATARDQVKVYITAKDDEGNLLGNLQKTLSLKASRGEVKILPLSEVDGLYQATVEYTGTNRHAVVISATNGNQEVGSQAVIFDPDLIAKEATSGNQFILSLSENVVATLIGLLALLAVLTALLWKLARSR